MHAVLIWQYYESCPLLSSILVMWSECRFLDTEVDGSNPGIVCCVIGIVSLSKTLYPHCLCRLSCEIITRREQPREGIQCYELFGGIALKNHTFLSGYTQNGLSHIGP